MQVINAVNQTVKMLNAAVSTEKIESVPGKINKELT
jgi:hypothetical protein